VAVVVVGLSTVRLLIAQQVVLTLQDRLAIVQNLVAVNQNQEAVQSQDQFVPQTKRFSFFSEKLNKICLKKEIFLLILTRDPKAFIVLSLSFFKIKAFRAFNI
jgi:hypothetical protein